MKKAMKIPISKYSFEVCKEILIQLLQENQICDTVERGGGVTHIGDLVKIQ